MSYLRNEDKKILSKASINLLTLQTIVTEVEDKLPMFHLPEGLSNFHTYFIDADRRLNHSADYGNQQ